MHGQLHVVTHGPSPALDFTRDGHTIERTLPARVLVSGVDASVVAARLGFGLNQAPRTHLASGALVEVLSGFPPAPTPMSILYPSRRQMPPHVRTFIDWLAGELSPYLR